MAETKNGVELDERTIREQDALAATSPSELTALDALGVERIVTTTVDYTPPQVDPDPKEVARLERLNGVLSGKRDERLSQLTSVPDGGGTVARDAIAEEQNVGAAGAWTSGGGSTSSTTEKKPAAKKADS